MVRQCGAVATSQFSGEQLVGLLMNDSDRENSMELETCPKRKNYFDQRFRKKIARYKQLGNRYRAFYYLLTGIALVSSPIVPVLVQYGAGQDVLLLFSSLVTISLSAESLFHFREHWRNYDIAEESLRRQEFLFGTRADLYLGKSDDEAFQLFVSKVEEIIQVERHATIQMRTADPGVENPLTQRQNKKP